VQLTSLAQKEKPVRRFDEYLKLLSGRHLQKPPGICPSGHMKSERGVGEEVGSEGTREKRKKVDERGGLLILLRERFQCERQRSVLDRSQPRAMKAKKKGRAQEEEKNAQRCLG